MCVCFWFAAQLYGCYQSVDKLLCGEDRTCQPDIKWVGVAIGVTAPPIVTRSHYNQGLQVTYEDIKTQGLMQTLS